MLIDAGMWTCASCTLVNPVARDACDACGTSQPGSGIAVASPRSPELQRGSRHEGLFYIGGGCGGQGDARFLRWVTEHRAALPEYRDAVSSICVRPELMAESRTSHVAEMLMARSSSGGAPSSFDGVAQAAVQKAWGLRSASSAKSFTCNIPGLADGSPFSGAQQTYRSLEEWQRKLLTLALHYLTTAGSTDDVQMALGMLLRGAKECHSRKAWAFYNVIARCKPQQSQISHDPLTTARARIMEAAADFLDDEKDAALDTYFLEPSWMYLAAVNDGNPDVNVHGANTYLAALAAALGVRFSREPFLEDESKGVAPFLEHKFESGVLEQLQKPENFGKSWQAVRECRNPRISRSAPRCAHKWLRDGGRPIDAANMAIGSDSRLRSKLRPYLEAFASAFTAQRLLPRLFNRLVQSDELTAALNVELRSFHHEGLRTDADDDGSETDCRYFLWNLDEAQPTFRLSRAVTLFQRVGFVKQELEL